MKIFVEKDYDSMSQRAFALFQEFLPEIRVLGLATGNSPLGLYRRISDACATGSVTLEKIHTFNLDEYFGIEQNHKDSYWTFMNKNLFNQVDIQKENIHFPKSFGDPQKIVSSYDSELDEVGHPDLQILGIGQNGHIAFNEPGSPRNARTRIVKLSQKTIEVNAPPTDQAITMGLGDIMKSKRLILLASGKSKADAVSKMVEGPIHDEVPASYLQEHPAAYIVIDRNAAEKLDPDPLMK